MNDHPTSQEPQKAVALRYRQEEDDAPRVVAKGRGLVAEKIKALAEESGVPIREDDDLVELLGQVDIDREVPPQLYAAVAEILAWVYRANESIRKEML
jgi:flagellar biosynthesis protein